MCLFLDSILFVRMSFLAIQHSLDYCSSTAGFEILWNKLFNFIILFQDCLTILDSLHLILYPVFAFAFPLYPAHLLDLFISSILKDLASQYCVRDFVSVFRKDIGLEFSYNGFVRFHFLEVVSC